MTEQTFDRETVVDLVSAVAREERLHRPCEISIVLRRESGVPAGASGVPTEWRMDCIATDNYACYVESLWSNIADCDYPTAHDLMNLVNRLFSIKHDLGVEPLAVLSLWQS